MNNGEQAVRPMGHRGSPLCFASCMWSPSPGDRCCRWTPSSSGQRHERVVRKHCAWHWMAGRDDPAANGLTAVRTNGKPEPPDPFTRLLFHFQFLTLHSFRLFSWFFLTASLVKRKSLVGFQFQTPPSPILRASWSPHHRFSASSAAACGLVGLGLVSLTRIERLVVVVQLCVAHVSLTPWKTMEPLLPLLVVFLRFRSSVNLVALLLMLPHAVTGTSWLGSSGARTSMSF